jgi:N,N-dimethylformamidase beta subunit-like, C-terminal
MDYRVVLPKSLKKNGLQHSKVKAQILLGLLLLSPIVIFVPENPPSQRIALVMPLFTSTPYAGSPQSFYAFYAKHDASVGNVTSDLTMLSTPVSAGYGFNSGWGQDEGLFSMFAGKGPEGTVSLAPGVSVVTDVQADAGALFNPDGGRAYQTVVLGHEEYVTAREYAQFKAFVGEGGRLIEMSANNFYAEVNYSNGIETFWRGHGFVFNGITAWRSSVQPFEQPNNDWFGSYYSGVEGTTGESNVLYNFTDTLTLRSWGEGVYSYAHAYGSGSVFCLCYYSESSTGPYPKEFLGTALNAVLGQRTPICAPEVIGKCMA